MVILSARKNQAPIGSFLDQLSISCLLGGVLLNTGLICANLSVFLLGMLLFLTGIHSLRSIWVGAVITLGCYLPSFIKTVGINYWPEVLGLSLLYIMAWTLFIYGYSRAQKVSPLCASFYLLLSPYYWESMGIGFHNPHILFADTLWMLIPRAETPWVVMAIAHYLISSRRVGLLIILAIVSWQPAFKLQTASPYIDDVYVFPEGLGHEETNKKAIVSRRLYTNEYIYHAMLGINGVEGMSIKRHLTPIVESGYSTKHHSRILDIQGKSILLLICNDVLFTDIWEELDQVDQIVVTSHLEDLSHTPMMNTFEKRIKYLNKVSQKPVLWVDQSFVFSSSPLTNNVMAS